MDETLTVSVWRGHEEGEFRTYDVPKRESQTVLDVVTYIQRQLDPSLSYRFACRVGVCGSCAMVVNGRPRWTCRTHVSKVAGDGPQAIEQRRVPLVVDQSPGPVERRRTQVILVPGNDVTARITNPAADALDAGASLPAFRVVRRDWGEIGMTVGRRLKGALRLGPLVEEVGHVDGKVLDHGQVAQGLDGQGAVAGDGGCLGCHSQQGCREYCPKHLNPTAAIGGLKRAVARAALKGEI